jgi:DNA-binding XRE family transcriptional regulator
MRTFKQHLHAKLKEKNFQEMYDEERQLLEMALKIIDARKHSGLSQKDLAQKAHITQQQLSKIENGVNCNMLTFLKVCQALGIKVELAV